MPGNTGPKRTPTQRERDRAAIAQLHARRRYAWEIADILIAEGRPYEVTTIMVQHDLQAMRAEWRAQRNEALDRAAALAAIDELERTYWRAWEASQRPKEATVQETINVREAVKSAEDAANLPVGMRNRLARDRARFSKSESHGNPAFLEGVQWCIAKRCSVLGLDRMQEADAAQAQAQLVLISQIPGLRAQDAALADAALEDVAAARRVALGLLPPGAPAPIIEGTAHNTADDEGAAEGLSEADGQPEPEGAPENPLAAAMAQIDAMATQAAQERSQR